MVVSLKRLLDTLWGGTWRLLRCGKDENRSLRNSHTYCLIQDYFHENAAPWLSKYTY